MASRGLRFDDKVVLITHAGNDSGLALGRCLASRGAFVIINDENVQAANDVVDALKKSGGSATANYTNVAQGDKIVDQVTKTYGSIHILINNMGALPNKSKNFGETTDEDWDSIEKARTFGTYKTSRAAWPHFKKQKFGRIVNVVSTTAVLEGPGQAAHAAVEFGMIGFTETLAKEGIKYNIRCNLIMSDLSSSVQNIDAATALSAILAHQNSETTGAIFEASRASISRLLWERSGRRGFKTDDTLSPSAVLKAWEGIGDFSTSESNHSGPWDSMAMLEMARKLPPSSQGKKLDFQGKVAVVTGAGNGLGRQYALLLADLGARVVVNDLANSQSTVDEIRAFGGTAVADQHSVEEGNKIVETAINAFGGIHILINNAGILRDKSFQAMTDELWDIIQSVHLRGSYKTARAAWPHFVKQKYGRIINTTSVSGIYGNFGQSNYAAAKCGTIGLSCALAKDGKQYNIRVNTVAPSAGTQLTRTVMPEDMVQALKPDYVAPFTVALVSDLLPEPNTNGMYEIGSGFIAEDRLRRAAGKRFGKGEQVTPETLASEWTKLGAKEMILERQPSTRDLLPTPNAQSDLKGSTEKRDLRGKL